MIMSEFVSKCVLRVEVNNTLAEGRTTAGDEDAVAAASNIGGGEQKRKATEITVETFPSRLETPRDDWGLLPVSSRGGDTPPSVGDAVGSSGAAPPPDKAEIGFFSGNPFVEITKGILHLYKEDVLSDRKEALTLCLLSVPTTMTCHDLLAFTAPCHADISHIRVLRDSKPNQYMTLLTFRSHDFAMQFYATFNGEPYNSLEPDNLCRAVWVSRVEWAHDGLPPPGHTELPICPVCLERMDESVDGVLTILCNHAFHANCLEQWGDATCPVCRCVQSPEQEETSECEQCGKQVDASGSAADALWICLICGHVGCGRYQGGHAASHYRESGHCYALQLGSHRVWDYKGDNFVHRLLQNKGDGKLVASEGPPSEAECAQEKVDSVQLEFTYLLTSQLDEQRMYFEEKLAQLESLLYEQSDSYHGDLTSLTAENTELKTRLSAVTKEKQAIEKKVAQLNAKLTSTVNDLKEERHLGKALRTNQQQWQQKVTHLEEEFAKMRNDNEQEIGELKEQVRDLMFFIDAQQVIEKSGMRDDIAGGVVTGVGDAPGAARQHARRGSGGGNKGGKKRH